MAFFHPVFDFLSFRNLNDSKPKNEIALQESQDAELQWKRDFEEQEDNGVVGIVRQYFRKAKEEERLPANGLHIDIRCLEYTSPPLHSSLSTVPSYLRSKIDVYHNLKNRFFPDNRKQVEILSNVNFTIEEKSMTLVLGSPGSGKASIRCNFIFIFCVLSL